MAHDILYGFDDCKCRKEVLSKEQIQKNYMRVYKSLSDIDSNFDVSTRLDTVVQTMETPSVAMYTVTAEDGGYYPVGENIVTIEKYTSDSFKILTVANGTRYVKDTFIGLYNQYNNDWYTMAKIVLTMSGTATINAYTSSFFTIANNLDSYGNIIPIFTYTSLGGFTAPPKINVTTLIDSNMLFLCCTSSEGTSVTFGYTVILLGM